MWKGGWVRTAGDVLLIFCEEGRITYCVLIALTHIPQAKRDKSLIIRIKL
jgi:hypothetical protein